MLSKKYINLVNKLINCRLYTNSLTITSENKSVSKNSESEIDWKNEIQSLENEQNQISVLQSNPNLNPSEFAPSLRPTFNLAAYVNKSECLQQLVKLGVDLSKIEKRKGLPQFLLKLDFDQNIKGHLTFLHDVGVPASTLANYITKNPLIFKEDVNDLATRINYLESKQLKPEEISRIVQNNPFWLMFSTARIDQRLGYFQKTFDLSGDETRALSVKQPRLITYSLEHVKRNTFTIKEEMGLRKEEIRQLLLAKPRLWMMKNENLINRFEYIHSEMQLSHEQILRWPEVLLSREHRIKERHGFLLFLQRAQYNPQKDLYISPKAIVEGTDEEFVQNVAKSTLDIYDTYLKTL